MRADVRESHDTTLRASSVDRLGDVSLAAWSRLNAGQESSELTPQGFAASFLATEVAHGLTWLTAEDEPGRPEDADYLDRGVEAPLLARLELAREQALPAIEPTEDSTPAETTAWDEGDWQAECDRDRVRHEAWRLACAAAWSYAEQFRSDESRDQAATNKAAQAKRLATLEAEDIRADESLAAEIGAAEVERLASRRALEVYATVLGARL